MTFVKMLAQKEQGEKRIIATENWDKFSDFPRYEISVIKDSEELLTIRTARTTWKRKFKEIVEEYI